MFQHGNHDGEQLSHASGDGHLSRLALAAQVVVEATTMTDAFVSMTSAHVTRGRDNLTATAVYLMRAVGMSAFQTVLLPGLDGPGIHALNTRPLERLLGSKSIDVTPEIDRVIDLSAPIARTHDGHSIHLAANLLEVMLNVRAWNTGIRTLDASQLWGHRTVTFFVYDPQSQAFAPSKFCGFVPIHLRATVAPSSLTMTLAEYATLSESERRFDGHVAQRHFTRRLGIRAAPIGEVDSTMAAISGVASSRSEHDRTAPARASDPDAVSGAEPSRRVT